MTHPKNRADRRRLEKKIKFDNLPDRPKTPKKRVIEEIELKEISDDLRNAKAADTSDAS